MSLTSLSILPMSLRSASRPEYLALHTFLSKMHLERQPDDPVTPLEERIHQWKNLPNFVENSGWVVHLADQAEVIAWSRADVPRMEENTHLLQFQIQVLPEYRRQGIGRRLLCNIVETAERETRRLMITDSSERIPAGEAFLQRLGAQKALEAHTNQLKMSDLDGSLLQKWIAQGQASGFELGFWGGAYPDDQIEAIAALFEVMNTSPHGDLEVEDIHFTPEQLRQMEQTILGTGVERWTLYVREKETGIFAGFTEAFWEPHRPQQLQQGNTGVFPAFRKKGLGRWLKAAMLEKVLQERPQIEVVRTGNADSNAAMLQINRELGFQPYESHAVWQIETTQAKRYLTALQS